MAGVVVQRGVSEQPWFVPRFSRDPAAAGTLLDSVLGHGGARAAEWNIRSRERLLREMIQTVPKHEGRTSRGGEAYGPGNTQARSPAAE